MPTVRLIVRYDGTDYSGWQRQRGVPTVQEAIEDAASAMACERIIVRGAGRTDAGVHAYGQLAAFRTAAVIPDYGWRMGLTGRLDRSIAITDARAVQDDFDPRRASAGKRYRYLIISSPHRDPLLRDRAWHLWGDLDVGLMRAEAVGLVGTHDFAAFRAADCERETTVRTLFRVAVLDRWQGRDDLIAVEVEGTAFLKNMVRVIVGTLVDVGRGRLPPGTVARRLADHDRTLSGMTAPAQGLYLDEVFIKDEWRVTDDPLRPCPAYAFQHFPVAAEVAS